MYCKGEEPQENEAFVRKEMDEIDQRKIRRHKVRSLQQVEDLKEKKNMTNFYIHDRGCVIDV